MSACAAQASEVHGLKGEYFLGRDLETPKFKRIDSQLDFNWSQRSPKKDFPRENISVRWTGAIEAQYSELYTFHTLSDDGVRLWINDRLLIDNWTDHAATEDTGSIRLKGSTRYNLRLEYYQGAGEGVIKLLWSSPSQRKQIVPHAYLISEQVPRPELPPMRLPALELPTAWQALPAQADWEASEKAYQAQGIPRSWLILAPQPDRDFRLYNRKTPLAPEKTDNWRNLLQDPRYLPTLWTRPEVEQPGEGRVEAGQILAWDKAGLTFARTEIAWPVDGRARIWFKCRERGVLFLNNRKLLELTHATRMPRCVTVDLKRGRAVFKVKLGTQGGPWGFTFRIERDDPQYRVSLLRTLLGQHPRTAEGTLGRNVHLQIARYLEEAGKKNEALAAFREARAQFPLDEEVRVEAHEAEDRLQYNKSRPPATKAWPQTHRSVTDLLGRGESATADAMLRRFIARYPRTPESTLSLLYRGNIRKAWGLRRESFPFYRRAQREAPAHPEVIKQAGPMLELAFRHDAPPYQVETSPNLPSLVDTARRQLLSRTTGDVYRATRNLEEAWQTGAHLFVPVRRVLAPLRHIGTALAIRQLADELDMNALTAYGEEIQAGGRAQLNKVPDPSSMIRLAARYPLTPIAIEALNRAANRFIDQGRWREAEAILERLSKEAERLRRSEWRLKAEAKRIHVLAADGESGRALADLRHLRAQLGGQRLNFRGKSVEGLTFVREREQALIEAMQSSSGTPPLLRLATLGGNASRTGLPMEVPPDNLQVAWRTTLPLSPTHLRACERVGEKAPLLRFPLVAENRVFVAQAEGLRALDVNTGKLLWQVRHDSANRQPVPFGGFPVHCPSYAGGHLFLRVMDRAGSEIRAYAAHDGELRWRTGMHPDLHGLTWLGDPAVDGGSVFAVFMEQVRNGPARHGVACLNQHTGELRWKRYVLSGSSGWTIGRSHWLPNLYQGPPAVADGVVFAATGLRSVVALDAFTGLPLWLTAYPAPAGGVVPNHSGFLPSIRHQLRRGPTVLQVHNGMLFHAPPDAPGLFAFEARTGALKWQNELSDTCYLLRGFQTGLCTIGYRAVQLDTADGSARRQDDLPGTLLGFPAAAGPRLYVAAQNKLIVLQSGMQKKPKDIPWERLGLTVPHSCFAVGGRLLVLGDSEIALLAGRTGTRHLDPLDEAREQARLGNYFKAARHYALAMQRQPDAFLTAVSGWVAAHIRTGSEQRALAELDNWLAGQPERLISSDGFWEVEREALRAGLRVQLGQPVAGSHRTVHRKLSGTLALGGHIPMIKPRLVFPDALPGKHIFAAERFYLCCIELSRQPARLWKTYHGLPDPRFTFGQTVVAVWNAQQLLLLDRLSGQPLHSVSISHLQAHAPKARLERIAGVTADREVMAVVTRDVLFCLERATGAVRWTHAAKDRRSRYIGIMGGRIVELGEGKKWYYRVLDPKSGRERTRRELAPRTGGRSHAVSYDGHWLGLRLDDQRVGCLDLTSGEWTWRARIPKFKRDTFHLSWHGALLRCQGDDSSKKRSTVEFRKADGETVREYLAGWWPVELDFLQCIPRDESAIELIRLRASNIKNASTVWKYKLSPKLSHGGNLRNVFPDEHGERVHLLFTRNANPSHFVLRTFDWPRGYFVHERILPGRPFAEARRGGYVGQSGTYENLLFYTASNGLYVYQSAGSTRREATSLLSRQLAVATSRETRVALHRARNGVRAPGLHVLRGPDALRPWGDASAWEHADAVTLDRQTDFVPLRAGARWDGPHDLSAKTRMLWNANGLLISVETADDQHRPAPSGAPLEDGDSLRVTIDATPDWRAGSIPGSQWSATMAWSKGQTVFRPDQPLPTGRASSPEGGAILRPDGRGVRYQLLIPWSLLGRDSSSRPGDARQIRLGMAIFDRDDGVAHGAMEWGAGTTMAAPFPPWMGELTLLDISREWMDRYREVISKLPNSPEALRFLRRLTRSHRGPLAAATRVSELEAFVKTHPNSPNVVPVLRMLYTAYRDSGQTFPQRKLAELVKAAKCPGALIQKITAWPRPSGPGSGLQGEYFDNRDFTGLQTVRIDPVIHFTWESKGPTPRMSPTDFSIRWTGVLSPRYSDIYTLYTKSNDGVRLWVNGQLLIENWTDHPASEDQGRIQLSADTLYDIELEYYQSYGSAGITLRWSSENQAKEIIPAARLYPSAMAFLPDPKYETKPEERRKGYRQAARLLANMPEGMFLFRRLLETYPGEAFPQRIQECEAYLKSRPNAVHAGAILRILMGLYPKVKRDPVASCRALMQSHRIHQEVQREFYRQHVRAWTHWHLIGPLPAVNLESAMEQALPPEEEVDLKWRPDGSDGLRPGWKKVAPAEDDTQGRLDLGQHLIAQLPKNKRAEVEATTRVAYAFRKVKVAQQRRALLLYGANDRISIWINGKPVVRQEAPGERKDARAVDVTLKEGTNEILLKVGATGSTWGFYFRIADLSGCPLPELPVD